MDDRLRSLWPVAAWLELESAFPSFTHMALRSRAAALGVQRRRRGRSGVPGRTITRDGYVLVRINGRLRPEHRVIAERILGRALLSSEDVHHRNGDKADNRPENLAVVDKRMHAHRHNEERGLRRRRDLRLPGEENFEIACACGCGQRLARFDDRGRPRKFLPTHSQRVVHSRLTTAQVQEVRARFASGVTTVRMLAREYGIDHGNLSRIIRGQIYAWVTEAGSPPSFCGCQIAASPTDDHAEADS